MGSKKLFTLNVTKRELDLILRSLSYDKSEMAWRTERMAHRLGRKLREEHLPTTETRNAND